MLRRNTEARAEQALHNGFSPCMSRTYLTHNASGFCAMGPAHNALLSTWYMSTLCWKHEMHGLSLSRLLTHVQQAINLVLQRKDTKVSCDRRFSKAWSSVITQVTSVRTKEQSEHSPWLQPRSLTIFNPTFSTYHVFLKCLPKIPRNKLSCWSPVWSDKE